jgi:hypothetical protein
MDRRVRDEVAEIREDLLDGGRLCIMTDENNGLMIREVSAKAKEWYLGFLNFVLGEEE